MSIAVSKVIYIYIYIGLSGHSPVAPGCTAPDGALLALVEVPQMELVPMPLPGTQT